MSTNTEAAAAAAEQIMMMMMMAMLTHMRSATWKSTCSAVSNPSDVHFHWRGLWREREDLSRILVDFASL